jgi:hypothetical protein
MKLNVRAEAITLVAVKSRNQWTMLDLQYRAPRLRKLLFSRGGKLEWDV